MESQRDRVELQLDGADRLRVLGCVRRRGNRDTIRRGQVVDSMQRNREVERGRLWAFARDFRSCELPRVSVAVSESQSDSEWRLPTRVLSTACRVKPTEVVVRIDQPMAAAAEHLERALIQRALTVCEGNGVEAAKMLGLSRKGLYLKRQRFHL